VKPIRPHSKPAANFARGLFYRAGRAGQLVVRRVGRLWSLGHSPDFDGSVLTATDNSFSIWTDGDGINTR